jgi:hypothetical protein
MYYRNDTNAVIEDNGLAYCNCGQSRAIKFEDHALRITETIITCDTCFATAPNHLRMTDAEILQEYGDEIQNDLYVLCGAMYEIDAKGNVREWSDETPYKIVAPNGEIVGYERTREEAEQKAREMMGDDVLNDTQCEYWVTWDE